MSEPRAKRSKQRLRDAKSSGVTMGGRLLTTNEAFIRSRGSVLASPFPCSESCTPLSSPVVFYGSTITISDPYSWRRSMIEGRE